MYAFTLQKKIVMLLKFLYEIRITKSFYVKTTTKFMKQIRVYSEVKKSVRLLKKIIHTFIKL